jgi:hypothetical protein
MQLACHAGCLLASSYMLEKEITCYTETSIGLKPTE